MREKKREEAARRARQQHEDAEQHQLKMLQIAANEVNDDVDDYSGSLVEVHGSITQQVTEHIQKWAEYSEKAKEWYFESFALNGEPDLSKKSDVFEAHPCSCGQRSIAKMTLYYINAIREIEIEHCKCNPLIKQLLLKQMMPNEIESPRRALHFAMLEYLHHLKMIGQISNHCFVDMCNQHYRKTELSLRVALLSIDILHSVYFLYRKLVRYARDEVTIKYGLESVDTCLGCERKLVTMDGNRQLKRLKKINRKEVSEEGLFVLSAGEESVWGTKAEVDQVASQTLQLMAKKLSV
ncbi:hypothetical protein EDC96DRAFT_587037 [Choanephora cucurbitarum]|nr:hypothetical protein EDC96DRAFT_587037 [Choanephora cucurbitarum]